MGFHVVRGCSRCVCAAALLITTVAASANAITPTPTPTAPVPRLDLPHVTGMPGSEVEIAVAFLPMMDAVYHIEHEIRFARETGVLVLPGGAPDCTASVGVQTSAFAFTQPDCVAQSDCSGVRAVLDSGAQPFPGEAVIYTCRAMITTQPRDSCGYRLDCLDAVALDADGADLGAGCTDGGIQSSYFTSATFRFTIEPSRPRVGDDVLLQVMVSGVGTPPRVTLSGAEPFFTGDLSPRVLPGFDSTAVYPLRAAQPGTAALQASVSYTSRTGCPGNESSTSSVERSLVFTVEIDARTADPTATPTTSGTPTPTATADLRCPGDCDADGNVTVDDLVRLIGIALGDAQFSACDGADTDADLRITVDEILAAAQRALLGCLA